MPDREYNPKAYWESRLSNRFTLRSVGFLAFSESYNRWLYRRKQACLEAVFAGQDLGGKQVLDVGCGTGFFVEWYTRRGASVMGVDITQVSVDRLSEQYPGPFLVADVSSPAFEPPGRFDIVNMWDVIYHIVEPEAFPATLENLARCCKRGTLLLLTDQFGAERDELVADHVRNRCMASYQAIMPRLGFDLVQVRPLYHLLNRRILKKQKHDHRLAPVYYWLDGYRRKPSPGNLSLGLWRFTRAG